MGFFMVGAQTFTVIGSNHDESIVIQFLRFQSSNDLPDRRIFCRNTAIVDGTRCMRIRQLNPNEE